MSDWLGEKRSLRAAERILDAAAQLFAENGVANTQMGDIAKAAGCSRATLYRYFESRQAVQLAFVHRAARRVGAQITAEIAGIADPGERAVAGVLASLRAVRADPLLIAWFRPGDAGLAIEIAQTSQVIEAIAASVTGEAPDGDATLLARWLTRAIVSLLTVPGRDEAEEAQMLHRFIAPLFTATHR
jgi:AcrR family transcriptional regulator